MWCSQKSEDSSSRSIIALRTTRSETRSNKEYNFTRLPVSRIKLKMSHIAIQRDILLAISNQALGSSSAPKTTVLFRICRCSSKLPKDKKKTYIYKDLPQTELYLPICGSYCAMGLRLASYLHPTGRLSSVLVIEQLLSPCSHYPTAPCYR